MDKSHYEPKIDYSVKSPHYSKRTSKIDTVVIHYISAINILPNDPYHIPTILDLLTKPIPTGGKEVKVSAHYLISRGNDPIYNLVDEKYAAWHAGRSKMPKTGRNVRGSVNDFSIGIELVGGKWEEFDMFQYTSLAKLVSSIVDKYGDGKIENINIVGHSDIAPGRKFDPGPRFDWDEFRFELNYIHNKKREFVSNITDGMEPDSDNDKISLVWTTPQTSGCPISSISDRPISSSSNCETKINKTKTININALYSFIKNLIYTIIGK